MTILRLALMAVCLGWSAAVAVQAADLWNADDLHFGANALTVDGRTGLRWLNISLSRGFSYDQMQLETEPGGQFYGFRAATSSEVGSLFGSAGLFAGGWYPLGSPGADSISDFLGLIGASSFDNGNAEAIGIAGDGPYPSLRFVPNLDFFYAGGVAGYRVACPPSAALLYGNDTAFETVGNWLVAVPEPGTGTLVVLGCVLLGIRGKGLVGRRR